MRVWFIFRAFFLNLWYAVKGLFTGEISTAREIIDIQALILKRARDEMRRLEDENDCLRRNERRRTVNDIFGVNLPPEETRDISAAPYENPPLWKEPQ